MAHNQIHARLLVVVEGPNDIEFLRRISTILHRYDPTLPDLAAMERELALVFVPSDGIDLSSAFRFAGLGLSEFHLLDRDMPPATQSRPQVAAMVNSRPSCFAAITSKRSLENYLRSSAVFEARGFQVAITDDANVPELVARLVNEGHESGVAWDDLSARTRKRLCYRAKKWLNTRAVEQMTGARLAERGGRSAGVAGGDREAGAMTTGLRTPAVGCREAADGQAFFLALNA